jgi:hypothetical protein
VGVAGGRDSVSSALLKGSPANFGVEGSAGWLAEEVRECAGGVGGGSGPRPDRLARSRRLGLGAGDAPFWDKDASLPCPYLHEPERCSSSFRGCGRTLCFLNMRGWPSRRSESKSKAKFAWEVPMLGSETRKSLPTVMVTDRPGRARGIALDVLRSSRVGNGEAAGLRAYCWQR